MRNPVTREEHSATLKLPTVLLTNSENFFTTRTLNVNGGETRLSYPVEKREEFFYQLAAGAKGFSHQVSHSSGPCASAPQQQRRVGDKGKNSQLSSCSKSDEGADQWWRLATERHML